jgi:RHS repeat-associated protein
MYLLGVPIARYDESVGELHFYHADYLGTPQRMTDAAGGIVWEAEYLPFGKMAAGYPRGRSWNNLRLPGQYYDSESGLHHNWARYYDPSLGRYLSVDPLAAGFAVDARAVNPYVYAWNAPIELTDPTGWGCPYER